MKCPKCGNVSFDHLENCMKCSRDLSADRNELNLLDFRPEVPFLLGSLVGEMQGGGVQQDLSFTQETEIELGGLDMGEPPAPGGSVDMPEPEGATGAGSSGELSLSEIAMDDLETIEASALGDAAAEELHLGDLAEMSTEDAGPAEEDDGFLGLEFEEGESAADDFADLEEVLTSEMHQLIQEMILSWTSTKMTSQYLPRNSKINWIRRRVARKKGPSMI